MSDQHAHYAPSDAVRWLNCPAALIKFPGEDGDDSVHSLEGTNAHTLLELCLRQGIDAAEFVGDTIFPEPTGAFEGEERLSPIVSQEMAEHIDSVLVHIYRQYDSRDSVPELFAEAKVKILRDLCWGTMDCALWWAKDQHLEVIDLKYGQGHMVSPDSDQLRLYALGTARKLEVMSSVKSIALSIAQPRGHDPDGPFRTHHWEVDLIKYSIKIGEIIGSREAMKKSESYDPAYVPSEDACRWCPGKHQCPGRDKELYDKAKDMFKPENKPEVKPVELNEKMIWLVQHGDELADEIAFARSLMLDHVVANGPAHGMKVVTGTKNRQWTEKPAVMEDFLRNDLKLRLKDITSPKLLGIPAIEKLVKRSPAKLAKLMEKIEKPVGAAKLVRDTTAGDSINGENGMFEPDFLS